MLIFRIVVIVFILEIPCYYDSGYWLQLYQTHLQGLVKCSTDADTYFKFLLRTMLIRLLSGLFFSGMENQVFLPMITTFCLPAGQQGQHLERLAALHGHQLSGHASVFFIKSKGMNGYMNEWKQSNSG